MADISKYSVIDPRILQQKPKYAVEKGAQSITNQTFSAIANSSSQQTFQVQVPSENTYIDRAVDWVNAASVTVSLDFADGQDYGSILAQPGVDFSLAPFPTTQSVSTMQATINDQSLSINMSDVLPQVLRLADLAKTRKQRTCPTMLDRYYDVVSAATFPNSPVSGYGSAYSNDEVPNGAWGDLSFYVPTGVTNVALDPQGRPVVRAFASASVAITTFVADTWYKIAVVAGSTTAQWNAIGAAGTPYVGQIFQATGSGAGTGTAYPQDNTQTVFTYGVTWKTAEKLVLPPFIFADEDELSTGLFGVQNMQFTMNFNTPARSLRLQNKGPGVYASEPNVQWDSTKGQGTPFSSALIQVQFLTPSLDIPLPAKSIVPWMEFPRYISPISQIPLGTPLAPSSTQVQSQTITLPMIPDLLVVYVKPQTYSLNGQLDPTQADWALPVSNISLSFDNYSGLLSNHSQYELYKMSVNNGLEMDWDEWSGSAWTSSGQTPLVGGPLVLRPGRDFQLTAGQAPGLIGNFTLQFNLTVVNATGDSYGPAGQSTYGSGVSIYTVTANSGFFETIKGSSRILRGVVTEQDILGAPVSEPVQSMERMVGEGKHHKHVGHGGAHHRKGMHAYARH